MGHWAQFRPVRRPGVWQCNTICKVIKVVGKQQRKAAEEEVDKVGDHFDDNQKTERL